MIYIFWTSKDRAEAKKVAKSLLERRWIACATILPQVESLYRWKGKIEEGSEAKVIFKTQKVHFQAIEEYILANGSYETPEILSVSIEHGHAPYFSWVVSETGPLLNAKDSLG